MQKFDYNNYDKIVITTKLDKEERVINDYALFGWKKTARKEDRLYFDAVHLTFIREHKVPNKDKLQFLQVCYENCFNQLSDCEKRSHRKADLFLTSALLVLTAIAAFAIYIIVTNFSGLNLLGWISVVFCALGVVGAVKVYTLIRKKEKAVFKDKKVGFEEKIEKILGEASRLKGVKDEK